MVSRFSQAGQVFRFFSGNDGSESLIEESFFAVDWFYDPPNLQWSTHLVSTTHLGFHQSLHDLGVHYLEWYERLFHTYNRSTHKTWSYSGCIDGRDLGNQTYWVCVQAALEIRRRHGCNKLHGVESCTSYSRAGEIIEAMLGIAWGHENDCCRLSRHCMLMRTCVEAAVLGVERVWTLQPQACSPHNLVAEILHSSDFLVKLPEPGARGWSLQENQKLLYAARVEARNVNR